MFAQQRRAGRERLRIVAADTAHGGIHVPFQDQELGLQALALRAFGRGQLQGQGAHAVDHFQQLGKAQDHQRHRVIAVQVRVEDQIRLVAHAREQCASGDEGGRGRDAVVRRSGSTTGLAQQGGKLRIQFGAAHVRAELRLACSAAAARAPSCAALRVRGSSVSRMAAM